MPDYTIQSFSTYDAPVSIAPRCRNRFYPCHFGILLSSNAVDDPRWATRERGSYLRSVKATA